MFTCENVTLRPMELDDIEQFYTWEYDIELSLNSGWVPVVSHEAFRERYGRRISDPNPNQKLFVIIYEGRLVGYIQLARIDKEAGMAAIGIVVGEKQLQGRGIGSMALRIMLDFAFKVVNLERVYAEVFGFNLRSQRMMERVGFVKEGILRQHEVHNGARQDMHFYGILKPEFYQKYETIFK